MQHILGNFQIGERPTVKDCIDDMLLEAPDTKLDDYQIKVMLADGTMQEPDPQYRMEQGDTLVLMPKGNGRLR